MADPHAGVQLLQDCNPAVLEALRAALGKVTEPEFTYDIDYAASFLGWEELRHAPQDANGGLDAAAQDRSSQGHAKVCVLLIGSTPRCVLHMMRLPWLCSGRSSGISPRMPMGAATRQICGTLAVRALPGQTLHLPLICCHTASQHTTAGYRAVLHQREAGCES